MKRLFFFFILNFVVSLTVPNFSPIKITSAYGVDSAKFFDEPLREFSVILTEQGYYPNKIVAFEGEKIKLFVTSTIDKPECLVVQDHKIFLEAVKGKVSEGESVFKKAGTYKFYCPSSKYKGLITVLKKPEKKEEPKNILPSREIASEERPSFWTPRDFD